MCNIIWYNRAPILANAGLKISTRDCPGGLGVWFVFRVDEVRSSILRQDLILGCIHPFNVHSYTYTHSTSRKHVDREALLCPCPCILSHYYYTPIETPFYLLLLSWGQRGWGDGTFGCSEMYVLNDYPVWGSWTDFLLNSCTFMGVRINCLQISCMEQAMICC